MLDDVGGKGLIDGPLGHSVIFVEGLDFGEEIPQGRVVVVVENLCPFDDSSIRPSLLPLPSFDPLSFPLSSLPTLDHHNSIPLSIHGIWHCLRYTDKLGRQILVWAPQPIRPSRQRRIVRPEESGKDASEDFGEVHGWICKSVKQRISSVF